MTSIDFDKAKLDPRMVFSDPKEVLDCSQFNRDQKIEVLRCWAYDAKEMDVAKEEGMASEEPSELIQVLEALKSLGSGLDREHDGPTKHG